jgi:hypothetical protein
MWRYHENIFLFDNNRVIKTSFFTERCFANRLYGSFAAELAIDNTPEELFLLTGEEVLKAIGIFPKKKEAHIAFLAVKTIQEAINTALI